MPTNQQDAELWKQVQEERRLQNLARLLYGENRQGLKEPEALAMGDTVLNREELIGYPSTTEEVLQQPSQYAPFTKTDPNYKAIMEFGPTNPAWKQYIRYAEKVLEPGRQRSSYTHYFTGKPPKWASGLRGLTQVGQHWFGQEKRRRKATAGVEVKQ